jgi:predicted transcriptional regulator
MYVRGILVLTQLNTEDWFNIMRSFVFKDKKYMKTSEIAHVLNKSDSYALEIINALIRSGYMFETGGKHCKGKRYYLVNPHRSEEFGGLSVRLQVRMKPEMFAALQEKAGKDRVSETIRRLVEEYLKS